MSWYQELRRRATKAWTTRRNRLVVREFSKLYYDSRVWLRTSWLGVPIIKNPGDIWTYQEILHELRPELIIETGTCEGGSAYFLACMCDLVGTGTVVTVDIEERPGRPEHPRIEYITGSSTDPGIVADLAARAADRRTMVILDSLHTRDHVFAELELYAPMVSPSSYLVVEDSNINGYPVSLRPHGPGPTEALADWLPRHPEFKVDRAREKFMLTFNPGGYLRRRS